MFMTVSTSSGVEMRPISLVSGSSNPIRSKKIASSMDLPLVDAQVVKFANGEICCQISKNVRGHDVYIIQGTPTPANDNLMELLIIIDALKRASAASISAVMPHYGYARQDRKAAPRSPISAKLVADLITTAGANRVISMDLHNGQLQGFFNIPVDNIYASSVFLNYIMDNFKNSNTICISPDSGGVERVRHYAKKLGCDIGMIDKRRTGRNQAKAMNVVGDVAGKTCIIIDDIVDTAGTLVEACRALVRQGAEKVYACTTHAILSDPAVERIKACNELEQLIVTNTVCLGREAKQVDKIKVLCTADVFSKVIERTYKNESVSTLFIESE